MTDLRRLRYVTERFPHLQGLRFVPLGIPFLFSALWRDGHLGWVPWTDGAGARFWFLAMLAVALGCSFLAKAHYRRQFGDVSPAINVTAVLAACVFAGLLIVAVALQSEAVVSIPALVAALGLGYVGVAGGQLRWHYLAVAVVVALFGMLGLMGVPLETRSVLFDLLIAFGFVVIGVGDHLLLRRTLAPVSHVEAV